MLEVYFVLVLVLSGLFAILGVGGASIYVPLFILLGMPIGAAIPLALFINVFSTAASSFNYYRAKLFKIRYALWILIGVPFGAILGGWISSVIPEKIIFALFSLTLLALAWRMLISKERPKVESDKIVEEEAGVLSEVEGAVVETSIVHSAAGGLTGTISGLLGIGGGVFLVPFLIENGWNAKKAAAISTFVVLCASLFGFVTHALVKKVDFSFLLPIGFAGMIGAYVGSLYMANGNITEKMIKKAFATILLLFAIYMGYNFLT
ncbi:sulfite exporter TauE/SafE family protein [Candidatus Micrarchaeota archaeon]|nr:sulfite exporter TauE/SafE family protein [Candidatus Micrarchaeota archaeon]